MKTFQDFGIDVSSNGRTQAATVCPQCSGQRRKQGAKCLSINTVDGVWNCHHCGWSGNLKQGDYKPTISHWKPEYRKPDFDKNPTLDSRAAEWFKDRGISKDTLTHFSIASRICYMPQNESFVPAIVFPFYRNGEVVNCKYRSYEKHFRLEAGAERLFYNIDAIETITIIVEGELDCLSLYEAGFKNVISVPDGAPSIKVSNYACKFDFLDSAIERLDKVKTFILAVDNDGPGKVLEQELCRRLGVERCQRVEWPSDCKDANDVLIKQGPDVLKFLVDKSVPYPIEGVIQTGDVINQLQSIYERGYERGVHPGWNNVNELYTVRPGEMTILTGIPGHGKSEFLDALMVNLASRNEWRFLIYSPENYPIEQHAIKLIEKKSGKPFHEGLIKRMTQDEVIYTQQWVDRYFYFLEPSDDETFKLDYILDKARSMVFQKGINGLVIDPWNELDHERPSGLTETEYISSALTKIRQFARRNKVHVWVVAHPTKLYKDNDGNYPVPTPYDISGSAHWRNKADNAITVWRDVMASHPTVEIHVQKIRFKQVGKVGKCELFYKPSCGQYLESLVRAFSNHSQETLPHVR